MTSISFDEFLHRQAHRKSVVGTLARDHAEDDCDGSTTPKLLRDELDEAGAPDGAYRALERVTREYSTLAQVGQV